MLSLMCPIHTQIYFPLQFVLKEAVQYLEERDTETDTEYITIYWNLQGKYLGLHIEALADLLRVIATPGTILPLRLF